MKMIDPPSGWMFGFPKPIPDDIKDTKKWLFENGYPQKLIDDLGDYFFCRYWEEDNELSKVEKNESFDNLSQEEIDFMKSDLSPISYSKISDEEIEQIEQSTSKFMNWFIRHYSTSTEGGTLGYVDSMNNAISSEKIIEQYCNYLKSME